MGLADLAWMALIIGGAGYLLYRSLWRKHGCCQGCDNVGCAGNTVKHSSRVRILGACIDKGRS